MLQAHSFLWHYLWLAPHVLELALAFLLWRRRIHKQFPVFFAYIIFEAFEEFTLYALDIAPSVSSTTFWSAFCTGVIIEGFLKIAVIGELFRHLVAQWPTLANVGNRLISGIGAALFVSAAVVAAFAPVDNPQFAIVSRAHVLQQTFYIVQCGLVLFLFVFAAYCKVTWDIRVSGIALGFALVICEHMAAWAITSSGGWMDKRALLDLLNMATYHVAVLIWFYYLLVPQRKPTTSTVSLPENTLAIWNRELERLLQ